MDGLPALDIWDLVTEVLRSSNSRTHKSKPKQKGNRNVGQLSHVDHVTTNAHSSQGESQLHIFEDNEAVIKMIIKGSSHRKEPLIVKRHLWGSKHTKTNILIWTLFMSASMKAAIHMGPDYTEILEVYKNTNFEELQNLFHITQKLVHKQREILNVRMIECASLSWTRSSLAHDQANMWSKAKVRVYSDYFYAWGK